MEGIYYDSKGNFLGIHASSERSCGYCAYCKINEKKKGMGVCKNESSVSYDDRVYLTERCPDFVGREEDGYITRG